LVTAPESFRLHSWTTHGDGYQRLAEADAASFNVRPPISPSSIYLSVLPELDKKLTSGHDSHLKPGGWFELQEIHHFPQCHDGSMPPNHPVAEYWSLIDQGLAAVGINFKAVLEMADMMREAGFVNVTTRIFHVPIGVWPKNKVLKMVGMYWREILLMGAEPIALGPLTRGLKWSREEVEVHLVAVRKAYMDAWVHSHMPLHIICAQKPE